MPTTSDPPRATDSPAALVAIARAARLAGDRDLARAAIQQLRDEYGIILRFTGATEAPR